VDDGYRRVKWYLHSHDGEDEDDDCEYKAEVAERAKCSTNDVD